jgi:hypothetical protein
VHDCRFHHPFDKSCAKPPRTFAPRAASLWFSAPLLVRPPHPLAQNPSVLSFAHRLPMESPPPARSMRLDAWIARAVDGTGMAVAPGGPGGARRAVTWAPELRQVRIVSPLPPSAYFLSPSPVKPAGFGARVGGAAKHADEDGEDDVGDDGTGDGMDLEEGRGDLNLPAATMDLATTLRFSGGTPFARRGPSAAGLAAGVASDTTDVPFGFDDDDDDELRNAAARDEEGLDGAVGRESSPSLQPNLATEAAPAWERAAVWLASTGHPEDIGAPRVSSNRGPEVGHGGAPRGTPRPAASTPRAPIRATRDALAGSRIFAASGLRAPPGSFSPQEASQSGASRADASSRRVQPAARQGRSPSPLLGTSSSWMRPGLSLSTSASVPSSSSSLPSSTVGASRAPSTRPARTPSPAPRASRASSPAPSAGFVANRTAAQARRTPSPAFRTTARGGASADTPGAVAARYLAPVRATVPLPAETAPGSEAPSAAGWTTRQQQAVVGGLTSVRPQSPSVLATRSSRGSSTTVTTVYRWSQAESPASTVSSRPPSPSLPQRASSPAPSAVSRALSSTSRPTGSPSVAPRPAGATSAPSRSWSTPQPLSSKPAAQRSASPAVSTSAAPAARGNPSAAQQVVVQADKPQRPGHSPLTQLSGRLLSPAVDGRLRASTRTTPATRAAPIVRASLPSSSALAEAVRHTVESVADWRRADAMVRSVAFAGPAVAALPPPPESGSVGVTPRRASEAASRLASSPRSQALARPLPGPGAVAPSSSFSFTLGNAAPLVLPASLLVRDPGTGIGDISQLSESSFASASTHGGSTVAHQLSFADAGSVSEGQTIPLLDAVAALRTSFARSLSLTGNSIAERWGTGDTDRADEPSTSFLATAAEAPQPSQPMNRQESDADVLGADGAVAASLRDGALPVPIVDILPLLAAPVHVSDGRFGQERADDSASAPTSTQNTTDAVISGSLAGGTPSLALLPRPHVRIRPIAVSASMPFVDVPATVTEPPAPTMEPIPAASSPVSPLRSGAARDVAPSADAIAGAEGAVGPGTGGQPGFSRFAIAGFLTARSPPRAAPSSADRGAAWAADGAVAGPGPAPAPVIQGQGGFASVYALRPLVTPLSAPHAPPAQPSEMTPQADASDVLHTDTAEKPPTESNDKDSFCDPPSPSYVSPPSPAPRPPSPPKSEVVTAVEVDIHPPSLKSSRGTGLEKVAVAAPEPPAERRASTGNGAAAAQQLDRTTSRPWSSSSASSSGSSRGRAAAAFRKAAVAAKATGAFSKTHASGQAGSSLGASKSISADADHRQSAPGSAAVSSAASVTASLDVPAPTRPAQPFGGPATGAPPITSVAGGPSGVSRRSSASSRARTPSPSPAVHGPSSSSSSAEAPGRPATEPSPIPVRAPTPTQASAPAPQARSASTAKLERARAGVPVVARATAVSRAALPPPPPPPLADPGSIVSTLIDRRERPSQYGIPPPNASLVLGSPAASRSTTRASPRGAGAAAAHGAPRPSPSSTSRAPHPPPPLVSTPASQVAEASVRARHPAPDAQVHASRAHPTLAARRDSPAAIPSRFAVSTDPGPSERPGDHRLASPFPFPLEVRDGRAYALVPVDFAAVSAPTPAPDAASSSPLAGERGEWADDAHRPRQPPPSFAQRRAAEPSPRGDILRNTSPLARTGAPKTLSPLRSAAAPSSSKASVAAPSQLQPGLSASRSGSPTTRLVSRLLAALARQGPAAGAGALVTAASARGRAK